MTEKKNNLVRLTAQDRALGELLARSIPRGQDMTDCPSTEQLAEFIDGTLSADSRTTVIAHLAECGSCYDIVSDSLTVSEEVRRRSRTRIRRYVAYAVPSGLAAAAVLLLVFRAWQPEHEYAVKQTQKIESRQTTARPAPQTKGGDGGGSGMTAPRSYASDLAGRIARQSTITTLAQAEGKVPRPTAGFGFSSAVPPDKAAFRIGICLTRLEVARLVKDHVTAEESAQQLIGLLKPLESSFGPIPPVIKQKDGGRTDTDDAGRFDGFSNSIEALFTNKKESIYLMFGSWIEAAHLAATVSDAAFFRPAEIRAFKNELGSRNEPIGTIKDLSQLDTIISSGQIQPEQFKTIARLLADIKDMY